MNTVFGPLRPLLPRAALPTVPTVHSLAHSLAHSQTTPSSAIPSPRTHSSVIIAWTPLVVSGSGHEPAQGALQIHLSCLTRYLETSTEHSRLTPSLMIRSAAAVTHQTCLAVASLTTASLSCCLLHPISMAEAWAMAGSKGPAPAEPEEGGSLRAGRPPWLMA